MPSERPYSLSLFQMSFWFFLVIAAYVFMWLITDELDTITDSILGLIGIGAATALGAALIDKNKTAPMPDEPGGKSRGFLNDVMSDPTGVSLHRFQMFVWTLVLGVIFIGSVYKNLEMPEFSATLLGLMGISSGTYLGFKVPEKQGSDTPPGATTPTSGAGTGRSRRRSRFHLRSICVICRMKLTHESSSSRIAVSSRFTSPSALIMSFDGAAARDGGGDFGRRRRTSRHPASSSRRRS